MFDTLRDIWHRLRGTWNRDAIARETDAEFRFHIESAIERNIARGMSPEAARLDALRRFGGLSVHKEAATDENRSRWLEDLASDVRYAARVLIRSPRFTIATLLTIALSVAANSAIFSVVNGVVLRPLPFPQPNRLLYFGWQYASGHTIGALSMFQLVYLKDHSTTLEGVATYRTSDRALGDPDSFDRVQGLSVSDDFFKVTGRWPVSGRAFEPEEHRQGAADVAILSDGFWRTRYSGKAEALGQQLRLDGRNYLIVGVLPAGFRMPDVDEATDVVLPLRGEVNPNDDGMNYTAVGRMRAGIGERQVLTDIENVSASLAAERPDIVGPAGAENRRAHYAPQSFQDTFVGDLERTLWILLAAVAFVTLIACANVANLLLVRASSRSREIAVRATLGAARGRIVRQLLTESLLLSTVAGALGLVLGMWSVRGLLALAPNALPRALDIGLDWRVALFTAGLSLVTGLIFGLISALPGTRARLLGAIGRGDRGGSNAGRGVRETLVVVETAIAVVLLAASSLLITSFARLRSVDPGFDAADVLTVRIARMPAEYREDGRTWAWESRALSQIRALPGVAGAAALSNFPLERGLNFPITIEGRPDASEGSAEWRFISDGYFETLRVPLVGGRGFLATDQAGSPRVAVINESMARRYWPNETAIGKRIEIGRWKERWLSPGLEGAAEIVGVVADIREIGLDQSPRRTFYTPRSQWSDMLSRPQLVVRTAQIERVRPLVEEVIQGIDPRTKASFAPMTSIMSASIAAQRFQTILLGVFAGTALLLTAIGIYGVVACAVSLRVREIGVRMALGAKASGVIRAIVVRGVVLAGAGALLGLAGAFASTRVLAGQLFGVKPNDPQTLLITVTALIVVAIVASWLPARRAALVQPMQALSME